jgi:hypothetical protein
VRRLALGLAVLASVVAARIVLAQPGCDLPYCVGGGSSSQEFRILTNGVERWRVDISGNVAVPPAGGAFRAADGTASLPSYTFASQTNTGFNHTATSTVGVVINGTTTATFTTGVLSLPASGGSLQLGGVPLFILTAPTISSGFGTSPSIASNNFSSSFRVNVGTGGVATTGIVGLPAATTGWNCQVTDMSTNVVTRQTANNTTTVTVTAASAWTASDILMFNCAGF